MKVVLLLAVCVLSLHNGMGAPRTGLYKFVRCNPDGDDANCVTYQTQEVELSPDLPAKLPASAAQYLEAEPVEDESPDWSEGDVKEEQQMEGEEEEEEEEYEDEPQEEEEEMEEEGRPVLEEEGKSPVSPPHEESSGGYEGSTGEDGSGESWTEKELHKVGNLNNLLRLFPSRPLVVKGKPEGQVLKEDQILPL
ncbi:unnamed protein product [Ophioblennius macclurei]